MRQQLRARNLRHRAESCPPSIGATAAAAAGKRRCTHCRRVRVRKAYSGSRYRCDERGRRCRAERAVVADEEAAAPQRHISRAVRPVEQAAEAVGAALGGHSATALRAVTKLRGHGRMAHARACGLCRVSAGRADGARGLLQCAQACLPARSTRGPTSAPGLMDGACGARGRAALTRKTRVRSLRSSLGLTLSGSANCWQPRESRISRATRSSSRTSTTTGGHCGGRPRTRAPPCWQAHCPCDARPSAIGHAPPWAGSHRMYAHSRARASRSVVAPGLCRCGGNTLHAHAQDSAAAARDARTVLVLRRRRRSRRARCG